MGNEDGGWELTKCRHPVLISAFLLQLLWRRDTYEVLSLWTSMTNVLNQASGILSVVLTCFTSTLNQAHEKVHPSKALITEDFGTMWVPKWMMFQPQVKQAWNPKGDESI